MRRDHREPRLFEHFAPHRVLERLAVLESSARKEPLPFERPAALPDEQHTAAVVTRHQDRATPRPSFPTRICGSRVVYFFFALFFADFFAAGFLVPSWCDMLPLPSIDLSSDAFAIGFDGAEG
jgi:hypothetical protein